MFYGSFKTITYHEVCCTSGYGRYLGYLWYDCCCYYLSKKYFAHNSVHKGNYSFYDGYAHLASGLSCGFSSLAAGLAIGIVGDAGVRANAQQDKIFVGMILILIFGEALALYGLIVSLILSSS